MKRKVDSAIFGFGILATMIILALSYPAFAEEVAPATPSPSETMRQTVDKHLSGNQKAQAKESLKEILGSDKYNDIRRWANEEYYNLAEQEGNIPDAVKELDKLAKKSPDNQELKMSIVEGLVKLKEWNSVAAIYEGILKKDPNDGVIFTRLIDCYMLQRNYTEVIKKLEPIVKGSAEDVMNSDTLALAYVGAGRTAEAINLYKQKIERDPTSAGLRGRYAQALTNFGMNKEALEQWQEAYKLDPENSLFKRRIDEVSAL